MIRRTPTSGYGMYELEFEKERKEFFRRLDEKGFYVEGKEIKTRDGKYIGGYGVVMIMLFCNKESEENYKIIEQICDKMCNERIESTSI